MSKEKIKASYEALAESYNAMIDTKPHNAYYDRPNTLSLMPEVGGKSILDAACGPGKYAQLLMAQGAQVTGFDISPKMVELAIERNGGSGTFFLHDLSTPFEKLGNESFDIVLCALAMHYVSDWTVTVQEFCRVLKPLGLLIISIEHPFFEFNYFKSTKYFNIEPVSCTWTGFGKSVEMHSYRRPLQECISPLTDNGFVIDKLLEPKPTEEMRMADPKHFEELNAFPAFICIRAMKRR